MRRFNVTGLCVPESDYMVDISGKLKQIMALIDDGCYLTINRARQYGKTTTLNMLEKTLGDEYICASISFQGVGDKSFDTPQAFCALLMSLISRALRFTSAGVRPQNRNGRSCDVQQDIRDQDSRLLYLDRIA